MSYFASKLSNFTGQTNPNRLKDHLLAVDMDLANLFNASSMFFQFGSGADYSVLTCSSSNYTWRNRVGGWYIGEKILSSTNLVFDSENERIKTTDFVSGALGTGWQIDNNQVEFNNARIRGKLTTSVFEKASISSIGGNFLIAKSTTLSANMSTTDISTLIISTDTTFSVGEILRMKDEADDEWIQITSTITPYQYNLDRDKKGDYVVNDNPAWKKGTAVISYGTGTGAGLIFMTASENNAPYLSVITHTGTPWAGVTTQARLGNLNGYLGYSSDIYGIAIGEATKYLTYDTINGLRIAGNILATTGTLTTLTINGALKVFTDGSFSSGQTNYDTGIGYWLDYNGGTPRFSIGNSVGNKLIWDGTNLNAICSSSNIAITGGIVGNWGITNSLLYGGSGANYIGLQPNVGIWMGDSAFANAVFSVDPTGQMKAHAGRIGGWYIGTTTLSSTNLTFDSLNETIQNAGFVSGALGSGFRIQPSVAEFQNVRIRGKITTSVFEKASISSIGGNFLVSDSDILSQDIGN